MARKRPTRAEDAVEFCARASYDVLSLPAMSTATDTSGLRQRAVNGGATVTPTDEGKKTDQLLDSHTQYVAARHRRRESAERRVQSAEC